MKILQGFIVACLFILQGCQHDDTIFNYKNYNCSQGPGWDSLYVAQQLIGKWDWKYVICSAFENGTEYNGMTLEFSKDGTFNLIQNNVITRVSTWQVDTLSNTFVLTTPGIDQTRGTIYLCGDYLSFEELGMDICNNYFKRQ